MQKSRDRQDAKLKSLRRCLFSTLHVLLVVKAEIDEHAITIGQP